MTTKERRIQTEIKKLMELQALTPADLINILEEMYPKDFETLKEEYKKSCCEDCEKIDPDTYEPEPPDPDHNEGYD
jgi:capsid portal protein